MVVGVVASCQDDACNLELTLIDRVLIHINNMQYINGLFSRLIRYIEILTKLSDVFDLIKFVSFFRVLWLFLVFFGIACNCRWHCLIVKRPWIIFEIQLVWASYLAILLVFFKYNLLRFIMIWAGNCFLFIRFMYLDKLIVFLNSLICFFRYYLFLTIFEFANFKVNAFLLMVLW